jgi:hypothetical protein
MTEHPVNGEEGLAGICGAQNGPDAARLKTRHGYHLDGIPPAEGKKNQPNDS